MKKDNMQYYIGIGISIFLHALQNVVYDSDLKFDIYWFYDYPKGGRFITNIVYDIAVLFDTVILTYWLSRYKRSIFRPLFIINVLMVVFYFLFYRQMTSLILIPLYLWLVYKQKA